MAGGSCEGASLDHRRQLPAVIPHTREGRCEEYRSAAEVSRARGHLSTALNLELRCARKDESFLKTRAQRCLPHHSVSSESVGASGVWTTRRREFRSRRCAEIGKSAALLPCASALLALLSCHVPSEPGGMRGQRRRAGRCLPLFDATALRALVAKQALGVRQANHWF